MGFVLKYCATCGIRIPDEDLASGAAVDYANRTYCKDHVPDDARANARKTSVAGPQRYMSSGRSPSVNMRPGGKPKSGTGTSARAGSGRRSKSGVHVAVQIHEMGETEVRMDRSDRLARAGAMATSGTRNTTKIVAIVGIVLLLVVGGAIAAMVVADRPDRTNTDSENTTATNDPNNNGVIPLDDGSAAREATRKWTDDVSRLRERVKEATTGEARLISSRLRACYDDAQALIHRSTNVGVTTGDVDDVRKLALTIADELGFVLWVDVQQAYREYADSYKFVEAYEFMTAIDTRQESSPVPPTVFEHRDAFGSFHEQFAPALQLASDEYAQYRQLSSDTKAFMVELPRLHAAAMEALKVEGNHYVPERLTGFVDDLNAALTPRPDAEPASIPRVEAFTNAAVDVVKNYKRLLLNQAERVTADARASFIAEVTAFLASPAAVHFLDNDGRRELNVVLGHFSATANPLAGPAEDLETGRATDDFALLMRAFFRLQIAQYTIQMSDSRKRRCEALMLRAAEACHDLLERRHEAGHDSPEYVMQLTIYARYFDDPPFNAAHAATATERAQAITGGTIGEAELIAYTEVAMAAARDTQLDQAYSTVAWGYDLLYRSWLGMHNYFQQVGRDRCTEGFMRLLRAVSTRTLTDLAADSVMILSTRDRFSAKVWIDRDAHLRTQFGTALNQSLFDEQNTRINEARDEIARLTATQSERDALVAPPAPLEDEPVYRELVRQFREAFDEELRSHDRPRVTHVWRLMVQLKATGDAREPDVTAELMGRWLDEYWQYTQGYIDRALADGDWILIHHLTGEHIKYLGWADQYTTRAHVTSASPNSAESLWIASAHKFYSAPIDGVQALDFRAPGQQGMGRYEAREDGYLEITGPIFVRFGDPRAFYKEVRYQLRLLEYNNRENIWLFPTADTRALGSFAELVRTPAFAMQFDAFGTTPQTLMRDRELFPYKHTVNDNSLVHHDWLIRHYPGPDPQMRAAPAYVMRRTNADTGRDGYPTMSGGLSERYPDKGAIVLFVPEGTRILFGDLRQKP